MKLRTVVIAGLGLALACYVIGAIGWSAVLSSVIAVGYGGFALLCLVALALFGVLGGAWQVLLPRRSQTALKVLVWARMVRDAATDVLPFSQLGGVVLGARAAILEGVGRPLAIASLIVDVSTEMLAQIAFVALGIAIFIVRAPRTSFTASLTTFCLIGVSVALGAGLLFFTLRRYGRRIGAALETRLFPRAMAGSATAGSAMAGSAMAGSAMAGSATVTATLEGLYRQHARVALSVLMHLGGWIGSAFGLWLGFDLMGARLDFSAAIAIEALTSAARSAAVIIPNALGVQEAAYAVLAPLFGVGAEFGLAVSLVKRARDIAVGVPILLLWQGREGRALAKTLP